MDGPSTSHAPLSSGGLLEASRIKVMVVDDHADFRESLLALLGAGGFDVVAEAGSGEEALRLLPRAKPDVVLMDVRMPVMDGIETTRRLKALRPSVGVIALTAQEDQAVVRDMLVAGASGYVLKDSEGDDILNAVSQAALGGAVLSPGVTPSVIEELTLALHRERLRARDLEEAHVALVERVARRHELVSRLGHELRTPVTVILGVARTLAEGRADPVQQTELLAALVDRANSLRRLVERFETAVDATANEVVDLTELSRELAAGIGSPGRITVSPEGFVPRTSVNPVLARRILEELIDNACRFSPPSAPVEVRLERRNDWIDVRVVDQGDGIDPADLERIFEPLEQGERLDVRRHQGAGMGLALARAAARAMDGDVVVDDSGPEGSTFRWAVRIEEPEPTD
jgi:signal transduction histidine kinase